MINVEEAGRYWRAQAEWREQMMKNHPEYAKNHEGERDFALHEAIKVEIQAALVNAIEALTHAIISSRGVTGE